MNSANKKEGQQVRQKYAKLGQVQDDQQGQGEKEEPSKQRVEDKKQERRDEGPPRIVLHVRQGIELITG